jgi:hypothetical protein
MLSGSGGAARQRKVCFHSHRRACRGIRPPGRGTPPLRGRRG